MTLTIRQRLGLNDKLPMFSHVKTVSLGRRFGTCPKSPCVKTIRARIQIAKWQLVCFYPTPGLFHNALASSRSDSVRKSKPFWKKWHKCDNNWFCMSIHGSNIKRLKYT